MAQSDGAFLEKEVNSAFAHRMHSRGFFVLEKQRFNPSELDLLLLDPMSCRIAAIEIKRRNWKELLWQAVRAKQFSHYVIGALPESVRRLVPVDEFARRGLGLAFYGTRANGFRLRLVCRPSLSKDVNRKLKCMVYKRFRAKYGGSLYATEAR